MIQIIVIIAMSIGFLWLERAHPARELPRVNGWYLRVLFLNLCQFGIIFLAGLTWNKWFQTFSLFHIGSSISAPLQGVLFIIPASFLFYWWHRLRHCHGWWQIFHQIHHSATRIEALTSSYKHPLEMLVNSLFISTLVFYLFGASTDAAAWLNVYALFGELFYHANIHTPHWMGYIIQRPEHHSIHHETDLHTYNFGDTTIWDRLFGTFKDTNYFMRRCGFEGNREERLGKMLSFKNVNK